MRTLSVILLLGGVTAKLLSDLLRTRIIFAQPANFALAQAPRCAPPALRQRLRYLWLWLRARRPAPADPGQLALQVAAQLAAGYDTQQAWRLLDAYSAHTQKQKQRFSCTRQLAARLEKLQHAWQTRKHEHRSHRQQRARGAENEQIEQLHGIKRFTIAVGVDPEIILRYLAAGLSAAARAADERKIALAGPKATATLLAVLPPLVVAGAVVAGTPILATYRDGGIGSLAAGAGVAIYLIGILWIKNATERAAALPAQRIDPGLFAELLTAGIAAGADLPTLLNGCAKAFRIDEFAQLATSLLAGQRWEEAWSQSWKNTSYPSALTPIAQILAQSWEEGIAPGVLLTQAAVNYRAQRDREARTAAAQLGVRLALPLGICLLPAFVLLLIVPLVVNGISSSF